jgi:hypothetical protein
MDAKPYSESELAELRAEYLDRFGGKDNATAICRLLATIDALRAEAAANVKTALDACDEENALRAERDRYREALRDVAVMSRQAVLDDPLFAWEKARAALEGK